MSSLASKQTRRAIASVLFVLALNVAAAGVYLYWPRPPLPQPTIVQFATETQSVREGDTGGRIAVELVAGRPYPQEIRVPFVVDVHGMNAAGGGYRIEGSDRRSDSTSDAFLFPANAVTARIFVHIPEDDREQGERRLVFRLERPANAVLGGIRNHELVIRDPFRPPTVAWTSPTASSAPGEIVQLRAKLSKRTESPLKVSYSIAGGSARDGTHFRLSPAGAISFDTGTDEAALTLTPEEANGTYEPAKSATIQFEARNDEYRIDDAKRTVTVTISDADPRSNIAWEKSDVTLERSRGAVPEVPLRITPKSAAPLTVKVAFRFPPALAAAMRPAPVAETTFTVPAGADKFMIPVGTSELVWPPGDHEVKLTLVEVRANDEGTPSAVGSAECRASVVDADYDLIVEAIPTEIDEAKKQAVDIVLKTSKPLKTGPTVRLQLSGAATLGSDFLLSDLKPSDVSPTGEFTRTFPANSDTLRLQLLPIDDSLYEPKEDLILQVLDPKERVQGGALHKMSIVSDDAVPKVAVKAEPAELLEGRDAVGKIKFQLEDGLRSATEILVDYEIKGDVPPGTAGEGRIKIAAEKDVAELEFAVPNDALRGPKKSFTVSIKSVIGAEKSKTAASADVAILDDDAYAGDRLILLVRMKSLDNDIDKFDDLRKVLAPGPAAERLIGGGIYLVDKRPQEPSFWRPGEKLPEDGRPFAFKSDEVYQALNRAVAFETEIRGKAPRKDFQTIIILPHPLDGEDKTGEELNVGANGDRYVLAASPQIRTGGQPNPAIERAIEQFSGNRPLGYMPADGTLFGALLKRIETLPPAKTPPTNAPPVPKAG